MIELSKRQIKEADRVGGIELMLPYPVGGPLPWPPPDAPAEDEERDALPEEREYAQSLVRPACREAGLVPVRVNLAYVRPPRLAGGGERPYGYYLGVVIIGRRWVHARGAPRPKTMWHASTAAE